MNVEIQLLKRLPHLFNALNSLIENDGVYLYLVLVWLAMAVIAWILQRWPAETDERKCCPDHFLLSSS